MQRDCLQNKSCSLLLNVPCLKQIIIEILSVVAKLQAKQQEHTTGTSGVRYNWHGRCGKYNSDHENPRPSATDRGTGENVGDVSDHGKRTA